MKFSESISHFNENLHPHMSSMFNAVKNLKTDFDQELHCIKKRTEELERNNIFQCKEIKELNTDLNFIKEKLFEAEEKICKLTTSYETAVGKKK